jgi:transcriptional regulator with XRE-family HTH domain
VIQLTNARLKNLRKKKGYTQIKIQLATGIDQSDYSKIETGIRYPTVEQAKRLAILLDTSTDYIFGLTDVQDPYPRKH